MWTELVVDLAPDAVLSYAGLRPGRYEPAAFQVG
ncbi:MAG: hypothetical protein QOE59_5240 [Actinomycetota bacterium]|jgi:hypothetical protein|nr:hypothetical protein [Actinomycetota bacterium]